jgi:hypothetical protein
MQELVSADATRKPRMLHARRKFKIKYRIGYLRNKGGYKW